MLFLPADVFQKALVGVAADGQERHAFLDGIGNGSFLSIATVLDMLSELKQQGIAMIAIFHDQKKIDRIADICIPVEREQ